MKILILLLLVVSPSLNAPVEEYDVSHQKKPEHGVQGHSHPKLGREAKWTFNYEPGDITVDDVSGGDFSIGHSAKISIGDSSPQVINEAAGLPGLPDVALPNPTLPVCDGGPSLLFEDCFCKKTDGSGVLCPRNSRCYRGICAQPSKNPCSFDDNLLKPNPRDCGEDEGCSPQDLSAKFQWSDNTIVYYYGNEDTLEADKNFIRSVMDDIEEKTCFTFDGSRSKTELEAGEVHRLEIFIKSDTTLGCWDNAGNVGNLDRFNNLKLTLETSVTVPYGEEECEAAGLVIHELMHAVGVAHTQKREDRKNHIQVKMENLNLDYKSQYEICADCKLHDEIPYDCGSIMHYGTHENSNDGVSQVIVPEPEEENDSTGTCTLRKYSNLKYVKTSADVSEKDWELLNLIGNCPSRKRKRSTPKTIVNGTIIFPDGTNVQFPEKSSVHVLCRNITQLAAITIAKEKIDVSNRMSTQEISYKLEADFENLDSSVIMVATINIGWESDASNWIRSGDYTNIVSHPLNITANTSQYQKDIKVELYISP